MISCYLWPDIFITLARVSCILDATFNTEESRENARKKLGDILSEQIYIIECVCPEDIVTSRLKTRKRGLF